jgi:hypothetical protein
MKELKVTETQLRSWCPRRPSAGLKQKIFSAEAVVPTATWLWGGLAPTMACALLTLMAFNHGGDGLGQKPMMAMVLSNQTLATYAVDGTQIAQNHVAAVTFDWTNRSAFKSSIRFTPTTNFSN